MDPSLYNGRTLKSQLSTVHHGAKHSQTSRPYILTAATDLGLVSSELQHTHVTTVMHGCCMHCMQGPAKGRG